MTNGCKYPALLLKKLYHRSVILRPRILSTVCMQSL